MGSKQLFIPKVADHCLVEIRLPFQVPKTEVIQREVWQFRSANWMKLQCDLDNVDWSFLQTGRAEEGARRLTETILSHAQNCIGQKTIQEHKSTHPWLNEAVVDAVATKRNAEGTALERAKACECSALILSEYRKWADEVASSLVSMPKGSKAWWGKQRQLQMQKQNQSSIPALRDKSGV